MTITAALFDAILKCPTKCWLRAANEQPSGNTYSEWMKTQNEFYQGAVMDRLRTQVAPDDFALSPRVENLKAAKWRLAVDVVVAAADLQGGNRRQEVHPSVIQPPDTNSPSNIQSLAISATSDQGGALPTTFAVETRLHALERVPAEGRGKATQFIPIRFIFFNKLNKDDRLLLAFDAFVLSAALGARLPSAKSFTAMAMPR